jgi:hypothetical protein
MGYSHTNSKGNTYFLHEQHVTLKGGQNQTIYYFCKDERTVTPKGNKCSVCDIPSGKRVIESDKTGLPLIKG